MAKGKTEVDDDGEQRAVFVDTSLNTHLVLLVSPTDTISLLKEKILLEHPKCFPNFGEIRINALKVKRRGCYYHLLDSMFVKTAFYGVAKNWFLFADACSQRVSLLAPSNDHVMIHTGPSKTLPTLVASSKHLESGINNNEDDHCGNYTPDVNKVSGLEMPNKIVSGVHDELKLVEETLNPENLGDSNNKKNKKKRKRTGEHDDNGDENGERLEGLHRNRVGKDPLSTENIERSVGDGMKSTNNVIIEVSPPTRAKKKHKVVSEDAQEVPLLETKTFVNYYDNVAPELGDAVSKSGQEDMQKTGSGDVNGLASIRDSKDTRKRKKEKRHGSTEHPSKIKKQDVQEGTELHNQQEGTRTSSDKLVSSENENKDMVGLAPGSRSKKTKKGKKGDVDAVDRGNPTYGSEMADILENVVAPTQTKNAIHAQENSVTESMELGTKAKKQKVKKGKVSLTENTDLSNMEKNKYAATCISSNGHVENGKNDNFSDRRDTAHKTDRLRDRVRASSIPSRDGDQEADDTMKTGDEPLQTAEINKPSVSMEVRAEKAKRKTQKKQTLPIKDSHEFSVKEKSREKTTETDMLKTDDVNLLVDGDLYKDNNKTPLPDISMDVAEVRKTDQRASKQKVKKHDLPSSVDTLCSGHNMVSYKEGRGNERTSHDVTKLKDDDPEALDTEALQPPPIDEAEENMEILSDKSKKKTGKKQTGLKDSPPKSSMKERFDEKTREMAVPKSADGDLLVTTLVYNANHQGEASLVEDCNKSLDDMLPTASAGLAELRDQDKRHASEQVVKKLDLPSSVDTSSNQSSLSKSKKSKKGERISQNGTQLKESITEQKQDMSMPQPSEKSSGTFKEGIETVAPHADPINSVTKLALHGENGSAKNDRGFGSPNRKTHQGKKTEEPQKKLGENPVGPRATRKNMGEVVNNASRQKKGLLATPGAIFEDGSSASSDDEGKMDGSDCSTRTPSDNLSSSDYSEGESKGDAVTSLHDSLKAGEQDGANSNSLDLKNLTLHSILRSSSRYKKAKVLASQSQLEDSEQPVDFVPDSQANL